MDNIIRKLLSILLCLVAIAAIGSSIPTPAMAINYDGLKPVSALDVKAFPQEKEYTCGASAVKAVLGYFGKALDVSEAEIYQEVVANSAYPEAGANTRKMQITINKYLEDNSYEREYFAKGKETEVLDTIEKSLSYGNPVIIWVGGIGYNNPYFPYHLNGHYTTVSATYLDKDDATWLELKDSYSGRYTSKDNDYRSYSNNTIIIPFSEITKYMQYSSKGNDDRMMLLYSYTQRCDWNHSAGGKHESEWTYKTVEKDGKWVAVCKNEKCGHEFVPVPDKSVVSGVYKAKNNAASGEISNSPYKNGKQTAPVAGAKYTIGNAVVNAYDNTWCQIAEGVYKECWINKSYLEFYYSHLDTSDAGIYEVADGYAYANICTEPYSSTSVACSGKILTVVGSVVNAYGNKWYQLQNGQWIWSGSVKKAAIKAPAAPTVIASGSSVTVSWGDVANETSYDVYLVQAPWKWSDIKYSKTGLAADTSSYTFTNVTDGDYCAFVIARPNANNVQSGWTWVRVKTQQQPPAKPTKLTASRSGSADVQLNWDAVNGASYYEAQYSRPGVSWTTLDESPTYTAKLLAKGFSWRYDYVDFRIRAVNAVGASDWTSVRVYK